MVLMEQIAWPLHAAEAVCIFYFTNKFLYHVAVVGSLFDRINPDHS